MTTMKNEPFSLLDHLIETGSGATIPKGSAILEDAKEFQNIARLLMAAEMHVRHRALMVEGNSILLCHSEIKMVQALHRFHRCADLFPKLGEGE